MKVTIDYKDLEASADFPKIDSVKYLSDYVMRIKFSDEVERLIDFKPFLSRTAHPAIQKYQDEKKFSNFTILNGNLNWNNYDLIFPIEDLYNGVIE